MAVSEKRTHFGRGGEYFAMSELLLRGWNVAVPVVDVGDDVFVIDDRDKTTYRVQVKASRVDNNEAKFTLSRTQLQEPHPIELFYMLLAREGQQWRFFVIPQDELFGLHARYLDAPRTGRGRPPKSNDEARSDNLALTVKLDAIPTLWGFAIHQYDGCWPSRLPEISDGPGTVASTVASTR